MIENEPSTRDMLAAIDSNLNSILGVIFDDDEQPVTDGVKLARVGFISAEIQAQMLDLRKLVGIES